ncbi:MAG: hypothetical protein [Caudoviricetes sp.]|nr:MAG: hypothetical protein [Caudoviricetes sp.]
MSNDEIVRLTKRADYYSQELYTATQKLVSEKRDHKTTRRYAKLYQLLALAGWVLFVMSLLVQPASAATMGEAVAIFTLGWVSLIFGVAYTLCCLVRRAKRHDRG